MKNKTLNWKLTIIYNFRDDVHFNSDNYIIEEYFKTKRKAKRCLKNIVKDIRKEDKENRNFDGIFIVKAYLHYTEYLA